MIDGATFVNALTFNAGYNTAIVATGAVLLGWAGGTVGTFLLLRRRSLVSDALSHATLPGIGIAFLVMAWMGGSGRFLPGLLLGAAISAMIGLASVEWLTRRTRLNADAAIGAVLSAFFGFGVVLLTVIQSLGIGRQAGIGSFLLGSTSGMLRNEAITLAGLAFGIALLVFLFRRQLTLICFDETFARTSGIDIRRTDLLLMLLVMAVTVTGLRIVGLILVVALLIIPPVAARFWTDQTNTMALVGGLIGGLSGFVGTALSASVPNFPAGPVIVLVAACLFVVSLLFAPARGVFYGLYRSRAFSRKVHRRQGLLAILRGEAIYDRDTIRVLRSERLIHADGTPTEAGLDAAENAAREEALWTIYLRDNPDAAYRAARMRLDPIAQRLTGSEIAELERQLNAPAGSLPAG
ncbi:MAG: metal ABC transporter permease [Pseudomonadota bacterium]